MYLAYNPCDQKEGGTQQAGCIWQILTTTSLPLKELAEILTANRVTHTS